MFDTKIAIVLRDDLAPWQALNVTAFLTSGIVAQFPDIIGEAYRDRAGNIYNPLSIQPVIVLAADQETINAIHKRALAQGVKTSAYIEEMFATGHDAANRAVDQLLARAHYRRRGRAHAQPEHAPSDDTGDVQ